MKIENLPFAGCYVIEWEAFEDERGLFSRLFCLKEFQLHHLNHSIQQINISQNLHKGTLRGMHYQAAPYEEEKVVFGLTGLIYDVLLDLRPDSPTYKQWCSVLLEGYGVTSSKTVRGVYIPKGVAHGFQTMSDACQLLYLMFENYHPENARGVRWNDPAFLICWPLDVSSISQKDSSYALFKDQVR